MEIVAEEWRPVAGRFRDWPYEVSSQGRLRRVRRGRTRERRVHIGPYGYPTSGMSFGGERRSVSIHCLVAEAFIGDRPNWMTVNHKDGNKTNNSPQNLEYVTQGDNVRHAIGLGLCFRKKHHHRFCEREVLAIRELVGRGVSTPFLARWFGVAVITIRKIARNENYVSL